MGARASKNDGRDYVLVVVGDEVSQKGTPSTPSKVSGRKSLTKVSPVGAVDSSSRSGDVPTAPAVAKAGRSPSLGNIGRSPSFNGASSLGNIGRSSSFNGASRSRKMSDSGAGRSIAAISRAANPSASAGCAAGVKLSTAASFPWLIKGGSFHSLTLQSLELGRVIGTGLMGTVRVAKMIGRSQYMAIKSVRKDTIHKRNDHRHVKNEKELLLQLRSPFCIRLFTTFQGATQIHFAMELAVGGELFRRLNKKASFPPEVTKFYVCEIFSAIAHVQSLGYVYRDLKPENVMLDEEGHCKLVDFGFSIQPNNNGIVKTLCGTPAYLSPEQLDGKFTNGYSKTVDWWALGILLYELMTGLTPYCKAASDTHYQIYLRILKNRISFPRSFDSASRDLVQRLCHADVEQRLSAPQEIEEHVYFTIPFELVNARKLVPPFVPRIKDESDRDHYFNTYQEPREPDLAGGNFSNIEGF